MTRPLKSLTTEGATMTKSSLCTYANITGNRNSGRSGNRVCKITPHYMAAHWTGRQCADYFAATARQASSNYCIGYDGDIAMSVDEDDRAWTSASKWNDDRAITIECANNADSSLTDATWAALVNLCADICRRYGFRLAYDGTRNATLTEHRMFSSTDCPGAWLHARMGQLASEVNAILDGGSAPAVAPSAPAEQPSASGKEGTGFNGTYRCTVDCLNVRDAPALSGSVVASYGKGETVNLDDWYCIADGYVWGRYTSAAVMRATSPSASPRRLRPERLPRARRHRAGADQQLGGNVPHLRQCPERALRRRHRLLDRRNLPSRGDCDARRHVRIGRRLRLGPLYGRFWLQALDRRGNRLRREVRREGVGDAVPKPC